MSLMAEILYDSFGRYIRNDLQGNRGDDLGMGLNHVPISFHRMTGKA